MHVTLARMQLASVNEVQNPTAVNRWLDATDFPVDSLSCRACITLATVIPRRVLVVRAVVSVLLLVTNVGVFYIVQRSMYADV